MYSNEVIVVKVFFYGSVSGVDDEVSFEFIGEVYKNLVFGFKWYICDVGFDIYNIVE